MFVLMSLALALLLATPAAGAADTETPASADGPATHTVAADGSADFTSVQGAVDAADDGDTVVVQRGVYTEQVAIDKELSLRGDGPRAEVVIAAPSDVAPGADLPGSGRPYALWLTSEAVTVSDLTVATPDGTTGVLVTAGAPTLERMSIIGGAEMRASVRNHTPYRSMELLGASRPTIRDSEWDGYVAVRDGASATFEGNVVRGDTVSIDGPGESSVRETTFDRGSISLSEGAIGVIEDNELGGDIAQVGIDSGSRVEVRGNVFRGSLEDASIWVEGGDTSAVITDNTVADSMTAIRLTQAGRVSIEGNTLEASSIGIAVLGADASIVGNTIDSEGAGIGIGGADPSVTGNAIDAGANAIVVGQGSAPAITGNSVCAGESAFLVMDGADPEIADNLVCGHVQDG